MTPTLLCLLTLAFSPNVTVTDSAHTVEVNPVQQRAAVHFKVHPDRPTLVTFSRLPDPRLIAGNESHWYVTTPAQGLPKNMVHLKPKLREGGLLNNIHVMFKGYPVELVFESTLDPKQASSQVQVVIVGVEARKEVTFEEHQPEIVSLQEPEEVPEMGSTTPALTDLFPALGLEKKSSKAPTENAPTQPAGPQPARHTVEDDETKDAEQRDPQAKPIKWRQEETRYGTVRWTVKGTTPAVTFQARPDMAELYSLEVVRGKKTFLTRHMRYAEPLAVHPEPYLGQNHVLTFKRVHLAPREGYYLRLFFAGSRDPVYIKLRGVRG